MTAVDDAHAEASADAQTSAETQAGADQRASRVPLRLLASSARNSYDPELDIDWDAPVDPGKRFLPFHRVSLYGTELWDGLSDEQRIELSRHELASVASTGLWFEVILIEMLARWAYGQDPQDPRTQYALTEIGDETRHVLMFAKAVRALGAPTYRPGRLIDNLARVYKAVASGPMLFAPVLVAEEITDRLQRETVNDESVNEVVRMVNRIHVVEEARHVRFARDEVQRQMATIGLPAAVLNNILAALVAAGVTATLINPRVYAAVGISPKAGLAAARANPYYTETRQWMGQKIMTFLQEQGMVTWYTRPIYRAVSLI